MGETIPERQDLGESHLVAPDPRWARMQPIQIVPSEADLNKPHQLVSVTNTSDVTVTSTGRPQPQVHVVIDRFNVGHELQPGETKHDIDMLVEHIENFTKARDPSRKNHMGRMKPLHPIYIVGIKPPISEKAEERKQKSAA